MSLKVWYVIIVTNLDTMQNFVKEERNGKNDPIKKIDINVEKEKMQKTWVKELEERVEEKCEDGSRPSNGVDSSSSNQIVCNV